MSIIFCWPAILGPEMAAPILWAPEIFGSFLQGKPTCPIKFLALGQFWGGGGGGSANFILWAQGFSGGAFLLTVGVFLLMVRIFYLRWGES